MGFCIGGHLAFRAALEPDVRATVCFYGTGIHDGKLGQDSDAGSLSRAGEIRGKLLMVWGSADPHVPEAAAPQSIASCTKPKSIMRSSFIPPNMPLCAMKGRAMTRKRPTRRSPT